MNLIICSISISNKFHMTMWFRTLYYSVFWCWVIKQLTNPSFTNTFISGCEAMFNCSTERETFFVRYIFWFCRKWNPSALIPPKCLKANYGGSSMRKDLAFNSSLNNIKVWPTKPEGVLNFLAADCRKYLSFRRKVGEADLHLDDI